MNLVLRPVEPCYEAGITSSPYQAGTGIIASGHTGLVVSLIPEVVSVYIPRVASQHRSGPHGQCRVLCGEKV
jgi:hypothetical protein